MRANPADPLERFLGSSESPLRTAAIRYVARGIIECWREGLITKAQALRMLEESHAAMRSLDS